MGYTPEGNRNDDDSDKIFIAPYCRNVDNGMAVAKVDLQSNQRNKSN